MAGLILIVAGFFRAGRLIALIPEAVINGFTIGIAAIIAASQLADALGLSAGKVPADMIPKIEALRSEKHTSELPSLMRISYAVFCLNKTKQTQLRNSTR